MLSCETCEVSKNIYFQEHLWTTATTGHYRKNYSSISFKKLGLHNYYYNFWDLKVSFAIMCSYSFYSFILWKYSFLPSLLTFFFWTNWLPSWNFFPEKTWKNPRAIYIHSKAFSQEVSNWKKDTNKII